MDPGKIPAKDISFVKQLIEKNEDLTKYCYKCFIKKEKDTIHCIICNKCFSNFGHHCYCINNCIANNNYCLFVVFLFETVVILLFILLMSILGLIAAFNNRIKNIYKVEFLNFIYNNNNSTLIREVHIGSNIFLIFLALLFLILVVRCIYTKRNYYCRCTESKAKRNFISSRLFSDQESSFTYDE